MKKRIAVIGGGSWGIALSVTLAAKGHDVHVWDLDKSLLDEMKADRENKRYLPGVRFPEGLIIADTNRSAIEGAELVLFAVPAQHFGKAFQSAREFMNDSQVIVNVAKGIEMKSLRRMSEIAYEIWPEVRYAVLSGPSHAEEVGRMLPTTVVSASNDPALAEYVQDVFMTERLRIYTNDDVTGVELAGALKNIIALGAGISDGMGFGDNAKAAMMTRGITEITRLGVRLGAKASTFGGLAGIGDLIVTCTSMHSRNRRAGILIGNGLSVDEAMKDVGAVVEGYYATQAVKLLADRMGVDMPITQAAYKVLYEGAPVGSALGSLMSRKKGREIEDAGWA